MCVHMKRASRRHAEEKPARRRAQEKRTLKKKLGPESHASTPKGPRFSVAVHRFLGDSFGLDGGCLDRSPPMARHRSIESMRTTTPASAAAGRPASRARSFDTHDPNNAHLASTRSRFTLAPIHQNHIDRQARGQPAVRRWRWPRPSGPCAGNSEQPTRFARAVVGPD